MNYIIYVYDYFIIVAYSSKGLWLYQVVDQLPLWQVPRHQRAGYELNPVVRCLQRQPDILAGGLRGDQDAELLLVGWLCADGSY